MTVAARQQFTFREYVDLEEVSTVNHEFLEGLVWAMAGSTPDHAGIAANVTTLLANALANQPCRVFSSDLRVRVTATGLGTYPDVTVVCHELKLDPEDHKGHTITNPTVLVEVLSPSTEDYDRGEKLDHYRQIESLESILLIAHDRRSVEVWTKHEGAWASQTATSPGAVVLPSLGCQL